MVKRVAVLTGANRGLGRRTAEILLEKYSAGFHYIFTQRSADHAELTEALKKVNPQGSFEVHSLEVTDKNSRAAFLNVLAVNHKHIDVIFNNAGFYDKDNDKGTRPDRKTADFTLNINFKATVEFTEEILPLLSDDAKIIEISSLLGQLSFQPKEGQALLSDPTLTKERLFKITDDYINNAEDETKNLLFSNHVYYFSKALLTAYVRFVAQKYIKPHQSVYSVHPGWVQTDMGGPNAPLTKDQACPYLAATVAELPFGRHELSGKLIFENKQIDF